MRIYLNIPEGMEERIDELGLADVIALLWHDPLKFQQYIRIYYPELSQEEIDRIAIASIRGLGGEGIEEEELHLNYKENLSAPTIEQDVKSTKRHSFVLSGKAPAGVTHIQVIGAYTRKIVIRQD
ncbi:MAG: hypothetical protein HY210_02130, partial [Candidatus Omnitrophica bacterium]|nr:hypothetical protein [Candidatus Omnitrophota bacterium]